MLYQLRLFQRILSVFASVFLKLHRCLPKTASVPFLWGMTNTVLSVMKHCQCGWGNERSPNVLTIPSVFHRLSLSYTCIIVPGLSAWFSLIGIFSNSLPASIASLIRAYFPSHYWTFPTISNDLHSFCWLTLDVQWPKLAISNIHLECLPATHHFVWSWRQICFPKCCVQFRLQHDRNSPQNP